jgi:hypothetical protein
LARTQNVLGLPRSQAPPGPDELLTELAGRRSFLSAVSAGSEGRHPASDALFVRFFAEQSLRERTRHDRLCPPRRQAPRSSPVQSAFHRRYTQCRSLARCVAEQCLRFLQPLRSTSTALDRLKPHRSAETSPCGDAVLQGFSPIRRSMHASWVTYCSLRSHANRASLEQDQIGSRRTGAAHSRGLRGATLDVHYPAPIGSDTFFREIVDPPVGGPIHPSACAPLPSSLWTFQSVADLLSRVSAAFQRAFARCLAKGLFYPVPPRRGP